MRERRKALVGVVTSDKMQKTVVVQIERVTRHPLYGKVIKVHKKYKAHDETMMPRLVILYVFVNVDPMSKDKKFFVEEVTKRAETE